MKLKNTRISELEEQLADKDTEIKELKTQLGAPVSDRKPTVVREEPDEL